MKMLYSVSQCTCNISPWAIIVLPDTVTLISTSSLLSAVFPSVWPVSANTVLESVCVHVCTCVFTAYCPVCFQVCELVSRHSVVWRQRPAFASETEKSRIAGGSELRWEEFHFLARPQSQIAPEAQGPFRYLLVTSTWPGFPSVCFPWRIAHSQICLLELALKLKWRANMYVNWVGQNEIFGKRSVSVNPLWSQIWWKSIC